MFEIGKSKKRLVLPQTLKGFQDLLPEDMISRNEITEKIRKVYEKYGFLPIDTPILEYLATLVGTGGEETNKQLFQLESPEREPIAMRFDLTVPFARLIAQYQEKLQLPFRRYHIGSVFRADKPSPGRFRQFTQFDIDIAGCESVAADAEIIAVMCEVMKEVGFVNSGNCDNEFQIRINNRKLVNTLLEDCGIKDIEKHKHVLRVIDKLQKVGLENVRKELGNGRIDESGDPIVGVGLSEKIIDTILSFISISGDSREKVLESIESKLSESESSKTVLQEMQTLVTALESLGVKEGDAILDPSLARGLDYYTGPVFEAVLLSAPDIGSVMGGGRFEHLVERFSDTMVAGTGASIGLDRLMFALNRLNKITATPTTTSVLVISMPGISINESLKIASELRNNKVSTEVYIGKENTGIREQLSFANTKGIPIAIIIGEDEIRSGKISVKDLKVGMEERVGIQDRKEYRKAGKTGQITVNREELTKTIMDILEQYK